MRATLALARRTSASATMPRVGGGTPASGPRMVGNGSTRESALRIGPDGGSTSFSRWRISERWMSLRSSLAPGVWSATAPPIQARPRPRAPISSAPPIPSSTATGPNAIRRRIR